MNSPTPPPSSAGHTGDVDTKHAPAAVTTHAAAHHHKCGCSTRSMNTLLAVVMRSSSQPKNDRPDVMASTSARVGTRLNGLLSRLLFLLPRSRTRDRWADDYGLCVLVDDLDLSREKSGLRLG
jgi:hypothetical protein